MAAIVDAFRDYFQRTQLNGESLLDCTRRFKVAREVLTSHLGGPIELKKHVKDRPDYVAGRQEVIDQLTVAADEKLATCLCLMNSDQGKHGSALKNLNSQRSLKNDQFPKTIVDGNSVLSNHEFDESLSKKKGRRGFVPRTSRSKKKVGDEDESQDEDLTLSFAQLECTCYCCGKKGHTSSTCHLKDKLPKDQWAINKSKSQFLQQEADKRKKQDSLGKCVKWAG